MSDVQARPAPPRGRGSSRGARANSGARVSTRQTSRPKMNGETREEQPSWEDEGEIGELKRKYAQPLVTLKELFPDWTDDDLVFALQETDGDLENTIERISEGTVSQWGKVEKKSEKRSRSKVHDANATSGTDHVNAGANRGGRSARGGREGGRGTERGRGSGRGGRGGSGAARGGRAPSSQGLMTDGAKSSVSTNEVPTWDVPAPKGPAQASNGSTDVANATNNTDADATTTSGTPASSGIIPSGSKKTWASMFAKPAPAPVVKPAPLPSPAPPIESQTPEPEPEALPPPPVSTGTEDETSTSGIAAEPDVVLEPPKDALTETNLEQVEDTSAPPATVTQASTMATSQVTPGVGTGTPMSSVRPPASGYASSAYRATGMAGRSASFQRRVMDQQEAVVMPNNHAVDRAAVQFGSLGLNGNGIMGDEPDVDQEREEAETRAQPPQHSPVAHPVAALPPAPRPVVPTQPAAAASVPKDTEPTPRMAPGMPTMAHQVNPVSQQTTMEPLMSTAAPSVGPEATTTLGGHQYGQFGRYAAPTTQSEQQQQPSVAGHKAYDAFGQPTHSVPPQQQQSAYDVYGSQAATQQALAASAPSSYPNVSSAAPQDYSYYQADQSQRGGYASYYPHAYGQHGAAGATGTAAAPHDVGVAQQRSGSAFGGPSITEASHYPSTQAAVSQARYGQTIADNHASGHSTPNPTVVGQQPGVVAAAGGAPTQAPHHLAAAAQAQQPQSQAGGHAGYSYNNAAYYGQPFYAQYGNQAQYAYGHGYGGYGGKGAPYGQPHQVYGIASQTGYEHSPSPANVGGYGRDGGLGGVGHDYGRSGSAQAVGHQGPTHTGAGNSAFGGVGMADMLGRAGFGSQGIGGGGPGQQQQQPLGQHHGNIPSTVDDSLKGYGDSKVTTGPSPGLTHPGGRAESAGHPGGPSSLPPSQVAQQQQQQSQAGGGIAGAGAGYGGYLNHPSQLHHGSQGGQYGGVGVGAGGAGGLGGLGGHPVSGGGGGVVGQGHQHQAAGTGYGNYPGAGAYGGHSYYGSSGGRGAGGWGSNYNH